MKRFGHFDDAAREYVITRPDTPLPWINYLGTEDLFGLVSNTGAGYTFFRDARLRRLTRYRYQGVPTDVGGRFLYLRDDGDGTCWSPTWQPIRVDLDRYECRHGLGSTTIASTYRSIEVETTFTIPLDEAVEVWRVRVANRRDVPARLSVIGAVEFCLWDALDDQTNYQRNLSTGEVEVRDGVIHHVTEYRERRNHFASFACSAPTAGFDSQREAFLGPYRGWDRPMALERGRLSGSIAHGGAPIGAHHVPLELEPGAERYVVFVLAYTENTPEAKFDPPGSTTPNVGTAWAAIERYLPAQAIEGVLAQLRERWDELLGRLQVSTPDEHADRIVNIWNPYQCMATFNLGRSASSFDVGIGRGIGFRDACQDLLGFVHLVPHRARERILDLAATQLPDGGAWHQYQPLTKRGNDAIGSGFNDDPLWLILAVGAYARETGDLALLDEPVVSNNEAGTASPLYEHLVRAARYTLERLGPHGLPLIGRADWNDCLNLNAFSERPGESFQTVGQRPGGVAESVFIAGQFVLAAEELAELSERRGAQEDASALRDAARRMRSAIGEHGWDGDWFRRAYDFEGRPVGSAGNDEGRLWIEPQGICVMAGVGLADGRAERALDAVAERLGTPHGLVLLEPAYSRYHVELGEISSYPPGHKENGGVFCHTNPWIAIAEARLGRGDRAFEHLLRINPSAREELSDVHRCEPYVYAQVIAGREAAAPGEAKNSWLTGAAAWSFVAFTQWILGIRPEHEGLRIDPCLPAAWEGFEAVRRFRDATFRIRIQKPPGVTGRLASVTVDGEPMPANHVPAAPAGTTVVVEGTIA